MSKQNDPSPGPYEDTIQSADGVLRTLATFLYRPLCPNRERVYEMYQVINVQKRMLSGELDPGDVDLDTLDDELSEMCLVVLGYLLPAGVKQRLAALLAD